MLSNAFSSKQFRRAGDRARDARNWAHAEELYRRHLRGAPNDVAIWTQLGHMLKEQARPAEAMAAYRRAVEIAPRDADPWLHLAHLEMPDDPASSLRSFERHYALTASRESFERILTLGGSVAPATEAPRPAGTFLLIDDLFKFLIDHVTLSGIQRVQVGLIESLLRRGTSGYRYLLSLDVSAQSTISFWEVPQDAIRALIAYVASGENMQRTVLDDLLRRASGGSRRIGFVPGDIVFFPGAFWVIERVAQTCAALKRAGVKIGVYIYDLIPISHPEFCHFHLVEFFGRAFTEMVQFVDFFATISQYVADTLADFLKSYGLRPIPITPLPLAHFLTITDPDQAPSPEFLARMQADLQGRPYALYVSTQEGRKNHIYVVNAWRELMRRGVDLPDLVFLGRKGWRSKGLFEFLEGTQNLFGKVHLMHDISDGDLAYLYRHCSFTLFTSFVEGWGLPVGESLVFGKPCIASDECSIPEVGGDLVDYVDPFDLRNGIAVIERLATDHAYRAERAERIAKTFTPRSWDVVTDGFVAIIDAAKRAPSIEPSPFVMPAGRNYSFRWKTLDVNDLRNLLEYPPRIVLGDDFYAQEPPGVWMRGRRGRIDLPTELPEGEVAVVAIELMMPSWANAASLAVMPHSLAEDERRRVARPLKVQPETPLVSLSTIPVGRRGIASIEIEVFDAETHVEADGREFYIGVRSLTYAHRTPDEDPRAILSTLIDAKSFLSEPSAAAPMSA